MSEFIKLFENESIGTIEALIGEAPSLELNEELITDFIEENFSSEEVVRDDFEEITYSILSSYLFTIESTHKLNPKKILCILRSFDKQITLNANRLSLIGGLKSQVDYVNSNELPLKEVLTELTSPLQDKISIAFTAVKQFPKLKTNLFATHFEFIEEELIKLDCSFQDNELKKVILELKEIIMFSKWIYKFIQNGELYTSVEIMKKSSALKSEVTKRLTRIYNHSLILTQHYCGKIEFLIWNKAKKSAEITKYLKENMSNKIPSSARFLLYKNKITNNEHKEYIHYEQKKVVVMSDDLDVLQVFKEIREVPFDKWDFFCYVKPSLLDAWMKSNKPDKLIVDYNFSSSVVENGIEFVKLLINKYPSLDSLQRQDQVYIVANNDKLIELNKYKYEFNFNIIKEPLVLKNIYENLLYE